MLELTEKIDQADRYDVVISLDCDARKRGRLRVLTDSGEEAGLFLERGQVLTDGDCLKAVDGRVVLVQAAPERLVEASTSDPLLFATICYHLGNRHTPVEIGPGWVCFQPDHVLAEMCHAWGLEVSEVDQPFHPESGAYGKHSKHHHD
jgi:urease accessory protein